ncbi:uncharacterized protein LOC130693409 [Daphnia carinata]|uniref:uncharacterized protein LOC130693409 n=1 Tax=Daphnia carinata TaxID=120202 RepID=UPI00257FFDFC|nr:uncharacterized protein LOC130693409 [Daphnia carinata]
MTSVLNTMIFAATILVTILRGTESFPVSRSRSTVHESRHIKMGKGVDRPLLAESHRPAGYDDKAKSLARDGIRQFPLRDDFIPSEVEAIISIQVTKQDIQNPANTMLIIEQDNNVVDSLEPNNGRPNHALGRLPTDGFIQPEHWLLVKDFVMDDYLFGELDASTREFFLQRILSGLILSQQTR